MSELTSFLPINKMLGWKITDDKQFALLGFEPSGGGEFAMGVPRMVLNEVILSLITATDAFPARTGTSVRDVVAMGINRFQFGKDDATGDFFLTLRLVQGGHLSFLMDRSLAEQLIESLNATVLGVAAGPPPGSTRN